MLGSITPLGERGRHSRWGVTVAAFAVGSLGAGTAIGSALGETGARTLRPLGVQGRPALAILAGVVAAGAALDGGLFSLRLPSLRRQVDEAWLDRYRGWVYGLGFGFQLGLGVSTVVNTSAVYAALVAAFLSRSAPSGALIGAVFGLVRAAPTLATRRVRTPEGLASVAGRLSRYDDPARRTALTLQLLLAVAAVAAAVA